MRRRIVHVLLAAAILPVGCYALWGAHGWVDFYAFAAALCVLTAAWIDR